MIAQGLMIPFSELTRKQVAEIFLTSTSTIDRWCKQGLTVKGETIYLQKQKKGAFKSRDVINFYNKVNNFKDES